VKYTGYRKAFTGCTKPVHGLYATRMPVFGPRYTMLRFWFCVARDT